VERFDASSYLYITRAMDYFDLAADHGGDLRRAFSGVRGMPFRFFSFTSDWLFPTAENRLVSDAPSATGAEAELVEIKSDKGHDAFLLDEPKLFEGVREFLSGVAKERGA